MNMTQVSIPHVFHRSKKPGSLTLWSSINMCSLWLLFLLVPTMFISIEGFFSALICDRNLLVCLFDQLEVLEFVCKINQDI